MHLPAESSVSFKALLPHFKEISELVRTFQINTSALCCQTLAIHDCDDCFDFSCAYVALGLYALHLLQPLRRLVAPADHVCLHNTRLKQFCLLAARKRQDRRMQKEEWGGTFYIWRCNAVGNTSLSLLGQEHMR